MRREGVVFGRLAFVLLSLFLPLVACSAPASRGLAPSGFVPTVRSDGTKIQHVVVIIQENRSFDNIFAGYPKADAPTYGYLHTGKKVTLKQIGFGGTDLDHSYKGSLVDYNNGNMNGFDLDNPYDKTRPYSFLSRKEVAPYWTMAQQYVLADHMFPSEMGGSFAAHLNLIAGSDRISPTVAQADNPSAMPWGCDAPKGTQSTTVDSNRQISIHGPFPCFTQFKTMADTMDAAHLSWRYYAPQTINCSPKCDAGGLIWSEFDAIKGVRYGKDWAYHVIHPQTQVLKDAARGKLPQISWVVPDWLDSDHALSNSDRGPSWVAAVVNAIGNGPDWNTTAIVVLWDDWGGWYDNVPPPQLDWEGLAIRVPCIIISPYAKTGYVSTTQYESGSVLKFMENVFGLPALGGTDQRANSFSDAFDFSQKARTFKTIPAKYPPPDFLNEVPSYRAPDDD